MNTLYFRLTRLCPILGALVLMHTGCNKLVQVDPPITVTTAGSVYSSDPTAIAVLNGIYASMSASSLVDGSSLNSFMSLYPGLSADELTVYSGSQYEKLFTYYKNNLTDVSMSVWDGVYSYINRVNVAIKGLEGATALTEGVRQQLLGEAKFVRALHYFYMVNLFGPVPMPLTDEFRKNALLARSSVDEVYQQIEKDLLDAAGALSDHFVGTDGMKESQERLTPTKWAAKALLARVYLYLKRYDEAIALSTEVIDHTALFELTPLNGVFLKNSRESIWQLQPVNLGWNTEDARLFVIPATGPSTVNSIYLNDDLLGSFEPNDKRRTDWVDTVKAEGISYLFPYKYKKATLDEAVTEYHVVLRLAEQFLIRGEARAQRGLLTDAVDDLDRIRLRAGLPGYAGVQDPEAILDAIQHERRIELFAEWGHRWLDLKRTEKVNAVMGVHTTVKGGTWKPYQQFYPIPRWELQADPNLKQTDGY